MATGERIEKTLYVLIYHPEANKSPEEYCFGYFYATDDQRARSIADERLHSSAIPMHEVSLRAYPDGFVCRWNLPGRWRTPRGLTWVR